MSGLDDVFAGYGRTPAQKVADMNDRLRKQQEADEQAARTKTPIPAMRGKEFDGVKYLRAQDVVDALEATRSWARVAQHITKWLAR